MLDNKILRNELISRRTFLIGIGKISLLSLLFGRLIYIQLFKQKEYKKLSEKNRISFIIIPPIRGNIYDLSGKEVTTNKPCFRLLLDKNLNIDYEKEIYYLKEKLNLLDWEVDTVLKKITQVKSKVPVTILDSLDWSQVAIIEECKGAISSLSVDKSETRFYPFGQALAHITGYIGKSDQKSTGNFLINNQDFNIGKTGLEKYYEQTLRGTIGYKQMEVNAYGRYIRLLAKTDSKAGQNLHLNIDADLQSEILPLLNPQGASALVMNIHSGDMLIMASEPSFEPNNFYKLTKKYWEELINDPYKPLINKTVHNSYPPGSVFKLITILAALDSGIDPNKTITCTGASMLGSKHFRCHAKQGHGMVNMKFAIKSSCNSYMYHIGKLIGADKIIATAEKFGFGRISDIDLPFEVGGLLPNRNWKQEKFKSKWSVADTMNLAIGQGFLLATPIQMLRFIAAIANKGKLYKPQVVQNLKKQSRIIDISDEHFNILHQALYDAVNTVGGTAYYSRIMAKDRELAGKTGTAQVQSKTHAAQDLSSESLEWQKRNHAVFIGFAPYHAPKYAITVFIDHGGGGGRAAAPLASKIMNMVLEKYG